MLKKQTETIKNGLNMLQESRCFLILTIENYIYFVDKPVLENPKKKKKFLVPMRMIRSASSLFIPSSSSLMRGRMIRFTLLLLLHSFHGNFFKEGEEEAEGT